MRRISPKYSILLVCLLEGVLGYASAPGTYPEEEMKAGNDLEMPKNPYQNEWTGYDFYYEKEPKTPATGGTGKMPAFQSIESVSIDRESPEDPGSSAYQASGSESGPKAKHTTTTPKAELEVAPSSSTKDPSTKAPTTVITTTQSPTTNEPHAPVTSPEKDPESGSDLSAADESLYGGGDGKDSTAHDPPPPAPHPTPMIKLTKHAEMKKPSYEDLGGPSGYDMEELGTSSKWSKGKAPGVEPRPETGFDYGQNEVWSSTQAPGDSYSSTSSQSEPKNNYSSQKATEAYDSSRLTTSKPGTSYSNPGSRPSSTEPDAPKDGYSSQKATMTPLSTVSKTESSYSNPKSHGARPSESPAEPTAPTASYSNQIASEHNKSSRLTTPSTTSKPEASYSNPGPSANPTEPETPNNGYSNQSPSDPFETAGSWSPPKIGSRPGSSSPHGDYSNPTNSDNFSAIPSANGFYGNQRISESQGEYESPSSYQSANDGAYPESAKVANHNALGTEPSLPSGYPDVLDYGARENNHIGKVPIPMNSKEDTWDYSNSNNAISARDPYDHFGSTAHHPTLAPPTKFKHRNGFEETGEDEMDSGYGNNDLVIVPLRSSHSTATTSTNTEVRAQISEIDRIAESFENSAREPVEYEQKITSESSKGITVEAGKDIMKHFGRKARKCCSCCDEKQPVSRNIETKVEPLHVQQAVDPSRQPAELDPVQNYVPLESSVGGSAYVQQPAVQPPQTQYQQPFQQYQPQYPQSYPYQQPACGCQPQPQNCCAPPAPCCLPTIPCCPPIPCCPQPKICCQPTSICLPPQQCCSINFKLPTIPICGRACPSCPCRRRVHKSLRLKRHAISSNCHQCSSAGEPWKSVVHHREKRAAPGCSSGFSTMQQNSCGTCGASHLRSTRVKRMGCLPCLGRKKRDTQENSHIRVKRMGCLPCLGRKKRSALSSGCSQCNSLGHLFTRYKRSLFGCSPCAPQPPCGCQGRKKRSVTVKIVKRAPEKCDASCCDYSKCQNRQKKQALVPFM